MEPYTRDSLRSLRDEVVRTEGKRRGSIIITVIIILIFAASGVFYIKTSKPELYNRAVEYIKSVAAGKSSLKTVSESLTEAPSANTSGESGEILESAETIRFDYLSGDTRVSLLSSGDRGEIPVSGGIVTSSFGERTDPVTGKKLATHHGIDIAAPPDTPVCAYRYGTMSDIGKNSLYGNYAVIDHADGLQSFYGHLSSVTVSRGDTVRTGQSIGVIGSTGKSTGVHLHFEIRNGGIRVDPAPYLYEKI